MENRLKERLTGAAILVALIVMVVPEMFRGQPSDVASFTGSSGDGPPVRSYTIDLSNSPTRASPLQSTPVGSGGAGSSDKAGMVMQVEPVNPPSAAASGAAAASPPVTPAAASAAPTTPAPAAPATASAAPSPAAPSAAVAAPPVPKANTASVGVKSRPPAASHNGSETAWIVQLGLFAKRDNAERLARSAQSHGFSVSISNADARGLYRVYAGGMADRSAAEAYTQRLKDQGLPAAVVASP